MQIVFCVKVLSGCTHHYDAGADEEPTCPPPEPEGKALIPKHHLNVFNKTIPSCKPQDKHSQLWIEALFCSKMYSTVSSIMMIFTIYVADANNLQETQH